MSGERADALRQAATVHDIGKIYVPAELLSKPGRLTETEFALIKAHAGVGHQILATIQFPLPIVEIVHQHHERMDGSGHPSGVSGENIILEARILALADVIEAMCSHRPYRRALGANKAMAEIQQRAGVLYDPGVVEACLRVFTKKRFRFRKWTAGVRP